MFSLRVDKDHHRAGGTRVAADARPPTSRTMTSRSSSIKWPSANPIEAARSLGQCILCSHPNKMASSAKIRMSTVVTSDLAPEATDYILMMAFSDSRRFELCSPFSIQSFCLFVRLSVCSLVCLSVSYPIGYNATTQNSIFLLLSRRTFKLERVALLENEFSRMDTRKRGTRSDFGFQGTQCVSVICHKPVGGSNVRRHNLYKLPP
jgi:hypothetical protein